MNQFSSSHWVNSAVFYHIYPLGFCGAPTHRDLSVGPVERLLKVDEWLPHLQELGVSALYLGPLFESSAHGYDTADYYHLDRRLGTDETLRFVADRIHQRGMRLILDGVFNHVGRDFWAFRDVQQYQSTSRYCDWFLNLQFGKTSPCGDPFSYEGWAGNYDLVKLNLHNPEVKDHLLGAVRSWVERFDIDGLRLDAADVVDHSFLDELHSFTRQLKPDFWLMGEMVGGDYRSLANPDRLDATTNYECYKGLYSSLVDKNYFEIAYSISRQFGSGGIYKGLSLYAFADNHDVNRVASNLKTPKYLYPLYCLLFTMPGVPSIYYGSEWGIQGERSRSDDSALRPCLDLESLRRSSPQPDLPKTIRKLADLRKGSEALRFGDYQQVFVASQQFAFLREGNTEKDLVILNSADQPVTLTLSLPGQNGIAVDLLNNQETFAVNNGSMTLSIPPCWGRVLRIN